MMKALIGKLFNPGTINLASKLGSKGAFLVFNFYLINVLSVEDLAKFALFWATLRILTFFGVNSMNITRFNEVREQLLGNQPQNGLFVEILFSVLINHVVLYLITLLLFQDFALISMANIAALAFSLIRLLADYSRFDGKVSGSIWIEDVFFTINFIALSLVFMVLMEPKAAVTLAIVISGVCGILCSFVVFRKKLAASGTRFQLMYALPKARDILFNTEFTILKGFTDFTMYAFRYFGMLFYGSQMVAETHILIQQYNIFSLVSISIISGFQSKIVLTEDQKITKNWLISTYKTIQNPTLFVAALVLLLIFVFAKEVLMLIAPEFSYLVFELRMTLFLITLFFLFNPLFYLFFMNKRVVYRRRITLALYVVLAVMVSLGELIENWRIWFFSLLGLLVMFPFIFSVFNLFSLKNKDE